MGDSRQSGEEPAREEAQQEGAHDHDTHLPASEEDGGLVEEKKLPQSWPGKGGPGTFPPPG
jgi:hypothetical protein